MCSSIICLLAAIFCLPCYLQLRKSKLQDHLITQITYTINYQEEVLKKDSVDYRNKGNNFLKVALAIGKFCLMLRPQNLFQKI